MSSYLKKHLLLLAIVLLSFSCKKDRDAQEEPEIIKTGEVTINDKKYTTVKIGNKIWTSVNYAGQESGISYTGNTAKPEYGRYYSFSEMQNISIPSGWRVPTEADFRNLTDALEIVFDSSGKVVNPEPIKKLTSKSNWLHLQGTNETGFNAFPGGYSVNNSNPMDGDISEFWMADGKTFSILEGANQTSYRIVFYAKSNQANDRFNLRFVTDAN